MVKIKFLATTKEVLSDFPHPEQSNKFVPTWYKNMPTLTNKEKYITYAGNVNGTVKTCVPFRDAMFAGYIIPLPFDVFFKKNGKSLEINSSYCGEFQIVYNHEPEQFYMYPIPEEYQPIAFKWNNPWMVQTPKGWSTLFTTPIHHDLPFMNLDGIVDTDKHPLPVAITFFIRKDFEGIIPKGTPIAQCIPVKRDNFVGYIAQHTENLYHKWRKATTQAMDRYKDYFHTPKVYKMDNPESKCPFAKAFKKKS